MCRTYEIPFAIRSILALKDCKRCCRPVQDEIVEKNLRVKGDLPQDLRGMFVRNGPNPQIRPTGGYHW